MSLLDIFTPSTISKVVDSVIDTGDALIYTDEEKAKSLQLKTETKMKMLPLFEPFKIAQRYLAFGFAINFILSFWVGVSLYFLKSKMLAGYLTLVATYQFGWIMLAIISFYFGGGFINSMKGSKNAK